MFVLPWIHEAVVKRTHLTQNILQVRLHAKDADKIKLTLRNSASIIVCIVKNFTSSIEQNSGSRSKNEKITLIFDLST